LVGPHQQHDAKRRPLILFSQRSPDLKVSAHPGSPSSAKLDEKNTEPRVGQEQAKTEPSNFVEPRVSHGQAMAKFWLNYL
jgi:hypothetical protein